MKEKKSSRMRNEDQYTFTIGTPPPPTEEELEPYRDRTDQPHESIQELMEGKSREEILMAQDRMKEYAKLAMEIVERQAREETNKETQKDIPNDEIEFSKPFTKTEIKEIKGGRGEIKIGDTIVYKKKPNQRMLFEN